MAVEPRPRADGKTVYGVAIKHKRPDGSIERIWELVGPNKRIAKDRERQILKELAEGVYVPKVERKRYTVAEYCDLWAEPRKNAYAEDERRLIRLHIKTRPWLADLCLDEVKPRHAEKLVDEMRLTPKKRGGRPGETLSDSTIANTIGVLTLVFDKAVRDEQCASNPILLPPRKLKRRAKEEEQPYTVAEAVVLMRHTSIPWPMRVLNALCLFTGMRQGEAAARRWRDLEETCGPLESLHIHNQWEDRPLKTERPRRAPIHPQLADILTDWAREGFELYTGRKPRPDDYLVPNLNTSTGQHTRSSFYKAFVRYARKAGVEPHSQHSCRHTFLSVIGRAGGNKAIYEKITHNHAGDIIDRYTHIDWDPLCEQMLLVEYNARRLLSPSNQNPDGSGGGGKPRISRIFRDHAKLPEAEHASIPGASTKKRAADEGNPKTCGPICGPSLPGTTPVIEDDSAYFQGRNRERLKTLRTLAEVDLDAARPGLAVTRALDAAYRVGAGDDGAADEMVAPLAAEVARLQGGG